MQTWIHEAVRVLRYPAIFFDENTPRSVPKASLFLLVSGLLVSATHYVFRPGSLGQEWWLHSQYVAGPLLVLGTVAVSALLHGWLRIDERLSKHHIILDKLPLNTDGTFEDTFIVLAYTSAVPALLLWIPVLLAPSIPALVATLLIGAYTGYVAAYGFALYHDIDKVTENEHTLLSTELFGTAAILFIIIVIILERPSLTLKALTGGM